MSPVYSGTFDRSIDAKNRLTIPSKWLDGDGGDFQVVPNFRNEYLMVMPPVEFAAVERRFDEHARNEADKQRIMRWFYSQARAVAADKQGRILLPEEHCRRTGLQGDVVLLGVKSRFEIWSRERWEESLKAETEGLGEIAGMLGL